jgi:hypothetical protein
VRKNTDGWEDVDGNLGSNLAEQFRSHNEEMDNNISRSNNSSSIQDEDEYLPENDFNSENIKVPSIISKLSEKSSIKSQNNNLISDKSVHKNKNIVELMRSYFQKPNMSQTEMQNNILTMQTSDIEKMVGEKSWQFLKSLGEDGLKWHLYYQIPKDMSKRRKIFENYAIPQSQNTLTYRPDRKLPTTYNTLYKRKRKPIFPPKQQKYGTIIEQKSWMERIFSSCLGDDGVQR